MCDRDFIVAHVGMFSRFATCAHMLVLPAARRDHRHVTGALSPPTREHLAHLGQLAQVGEERFGPGCRRNNSITVAFIGNSITEQGVLPILRISGTVRSIIKPATILTFFMWQ